ncbi:hypothetical protein LguiB_028625 [Lonicera macranthoides]
MALFFSLSNPNFLISYGESFVVFEELNHSCFESGWNCLKSTPPYLPPTPPYHSLPHHWYLSFSLLTLF